MTSYLFMFKTLNVVQHKYVSVAIGQFRNRIRRNGGDISLRRQSSSRRNACETMVRQLPPSWT